MSRGRRGARRDSAGGEAGSARRVGRDAIVYGLGAIAGRLASFILLPIYTRLLTPADYGLLELLQLSIDVIAIAVSAGTTAGVLRFFYKRETEEARNELMTSTLVLLAALNAMGAVLVIGFADVIHERILSGTGEVWYLYLAAGSFVLASASEIPKLLMQASKEPNKYVATNIATLVLQLTLNIALVAVLRMGVFGVLLSTLVTNVVVGTVLLVWLVRRTGFRVSTGTMRELRRFGVPYQIATAGTFILTFGDRFFLETHRGMEEVGLYSLAYKFGFILMTLGASPFLRAWAPQRFEIVTAPPTERDLRYNQVFRMLNAFLLPVAVALATGASPLIKIMSDSAFHTATPLVPLVVVAYLAQAWTDVAAFGIDVSEKTLYHTLAVWVSVFVILAGYALLIPPYGMWGAALATIAGFFTRFGMTWWAAQRLFPIALSWRPHFVALAWAGSLTAAFHLLASGRGVIVEILAAGLCVAATGTACVLTLLNGDERAGAWATVRRKVGIPAQV